LIKILQHGTDDDTAPSYAQLTTDLEATITTRKRIAIYSGCGQLGTIWKACTKRIYPTSYGNYTRYSYVGFGELINLAGSKDRSYLRFFRDFEETKGCWCFCQGVGDWCAASSERSWCIDCKGDSDTTT
jgi:hypothetical protein